MQRFLSLFFLTFLIPFSAGAGISLDATRLMFSENNSRQGAGIGVTSSPASSSPYLVKARVVTTPDAVSTDTPFVVSPSLFRLEPGTTNQLRIMLSRGGLPGDRESVYYLQVTAQAAGKNNEAGKLEKLGGAVVVSSGTVIKLFYRPAGLTVSPQHAMAGLQFSRRGQQLYVYNPSPYFITLSSLKAGEKTVPLSAAKQNTMLAPFSGLTYAVSPSAEVRTVTGIPVLSEEDIDTGRMVIVAEERAPVPAPASEAPVSDVAQTGIAETATESITEEPADTAVTESESGVAVSQDTAENAVDDVADSETSHRLMPGLRRGVPCLKPEKLTQGTCRLRWSGVMPGKQVQRI